jgi:L-rhamnose mutarotase
MKILIGIGIILFGMSMGSIIASADNGDIPDSEDAQECEERTVQRFGNVIGLREEKIEEYKRLHAAIWPDVAQAVHDANIRGMSIYLHKLPDGKHYLFMYFEYVGEDLETDSKRMAENEAVKRWWVVTEACQEQLPDHKPDEWWSAMEEVFHQE